VLPVDRPNFKQIIQSLTQILREVDSEFKEEEEKSILALKEGASDPYAKTEIKTKKDSDSDSEVFYQ